MGLLTRMRAATFANPDPWLIEAFGGMPSKSGQRVNHETAMRVATVFGCVRVLAESIAQIPLILYRVGDQDSRERAVDHPLYWLLHNQPNSWQTSFEWRELMMWHAALRGNGYSYINRAGGRIVELLPLDPDRVTVKQLPDYSLNYSISRTGGREPLELTSRDIFHLRGPSVDGVSGLSVVGYAKETIGLAIATEEHGARFFSNGARPSGLLTRPEGKKALSETAAQRLVESFQQKYSGPNAQRTMLLEEGMTFQSVTMKNDDMQFLETRKFQKQDICGIFRVPPHMVADLERATFSNIEQQSTEFVIYALGPWIGRWEQAIGRDLIVERQQGNLFAEFLVDGLLRGDTVSRYQAYNVGITSGWLTRNEARIKENLNPLPGLDEPLEPLNMVPAGTQNDPGTDENNPPDEQGGGGSEDTTANLARLLSGVASAVDGMRDAADRAVSASTAAAHRATTALAAIANREPEPTTVTIAEGAVQVAVKNEAPPPARKPTRFRRNEDGTVSIIYEDA